VYEELEIARAFVAQEAWAYEAAYRIHGGVLHAAALQVLRHDQDAQDCVHDVLLRLWRRGDAFRPARGSLRAFLAICVRNEALSRLRKAHNRERIEQSTEPVPDRADIAGGVVERESVRRALNELTEKQRQTIALAYFDRITLDEIAGRLGEPVGTVKSRLSTSLRRLRQIFTAEGSIDV
jgi:RNA polymerase sigma-70 factor (ECF subfamily)